MLRPAFWLLLVLFAVFCRQPQTARAQPAPGTLDPTFSGTGLSRIGFGTGQAYAYAVAVQSDGKLVMGGYTYNNLNYLFALARLDTNNVLDTTFGNGGRVVAQVGSPIWNPYEGIQALKIQPDGKIVAGGYAMNQTNTGFALARYNPDGSFDTTFGNNGKVTTGFSGQSAISGIVLQGDGKIVAVGYFVAVLGNYNFVLARYLTNGVLDSTFGSGGTVVTTPLGGATSVLLTGGGTILVAGNNYYGTQGLNSQFALARYTTNGVLDTTFGSGGIALTPPITPFDYAYALAYQQGNNTIQNPDKIVAAGYANGYLAIARYTLSGNLDTSFGGSGIVTDTFGSGQSWVQAVLVQGIFTQPRKITVAGWMGNGAYETNYFALARYTSGGSLDTSFGGGTGKVLMAMRPNADDEAYAATFQSGQLLLAGYSSLAPRTGNSDFAAARFNSDGSPDTTFGTGGVVLAGVADLGARAQAAAIQPDGKVVVAGATSNNVGNMFALARFSPSGVLDESFGSNGGTLTTPIGPSNAVANAVLLQPNGNIIAAGFSYPGYNPDFALARYTTNGALDVTFGTGGIVTTFIGNDAGVARAAALQADGKIVLAGYSYNFANGYDDFALARFTTNGALDTSFGNGGTLTTSIAGAESQAWGVAIQPDGKIVLAGQGQVGASTDFALTRYQTNGALDNSFGSFGRVATGFGGSASALAMALALQPDGRLLAAGVVASNGTDFVGLVRYQTNGTLDTSFGASGFVLTQVGLITDYAMSLAVQRDGKIVVGGVSKQGANFTYAAVRYNSNGSLDSGYGLGGKTVISFGDGGSDLGNAVVLDQIGRAVIVGNANNLFGVARLASEPFLEITSLSHLSNGQVALKGLGLPATNHTLRASLNLTPGGFGALAPVTTDAGGFWQYQDTSAPGFNTRFYRLSFP